MTHEECKAAILAREQEKGVVSEAELRQQLADVTNERDGLRAFANEMVSASFEGGSFDASDIQDIAEKHKLVRLIQVDQECGEACGCREYGFPSECYRKNPILSAPATDEQGAGS
ncbi:hypothetical protein ACTUVN_002625 [Pseudomonas caspiana]